MNEQQYELEGEDSSGGIYPNATIRISKEQFSVYDLKRQHEKYATIIMEPNFQRKDVWYSKKKHELIESILMGIPIPMMYFFEDKDGKRQVIDGKQRLTAIFDFLDGKFRLNNLKILQDQNGKFFEELELVLQSTIEKYQLSIYVIQPPTSEKIKFDIFDRVNRGGTILNHQEMRNALYQGKATDLLNRLVELDCFKNATNNGISSKRMKDKYLVLRFLSFYMLHKKWLDDIEYKSDIDDFLAKTMEFINKLDNEKITKLEKIFIIAMQTSYKILGKNGFRFTEETGKSIRPINMALFEVAAYFCNEIEINNISNTIIEKEFKSLKQEFDAGKTFVNNVDGSVNVACRFNKRIKR